MLMFSILHKLPFSTNLKENLEYCSPYVPLITNYDPVRTSGGSEKMSPFTGTYSLAPNKRRHNEEEG